MGRRGKRLASSSVSQSIEYSDRISSLPDEIAYHILSFLAMNMIDIAQLMAVSKRWRELCISIPSFTFEGKPDRFNGKQLRFMNFLDRLIHRRNGMKIKQFCIRWKYVKKCKEEYRVLTWLHEAVRCNVEVLDLELNMFEAGVFPFPLDVVKCESLRFLSVNFHGNILQLPSRAGFPKLQYLSLKRVRIRDQLFGKNVISSCKFLDRLCLELVYGLENINIMSSSLKYLEVTDSGSHLNVSAELLQELVIYFPSGARSIKVDAPHLKSLTWGGSAPHSYSFGNLENLQYLGWSLVSQYSCRKKKNLFSCSMERIKDLSIHVQSLKALPNGGLLPISLNSLRTLDVYFSSFDGLDDDLVPALASLLKGLPNVQKLCMIYWDSPRIKATRSYPKKTSGFNAKYWESFDLVFINQLKWVKMEIKKGSNIMQLLKYILEHATTLEVMDIFYPASWKLITSKLKKFKMATSAKINLCPKSFK